MKILLIILVILVILAIVAVLFFHFVISKPIEEAFDTKKWDDSMWNASDIY